MQTAIRLNYSRRAHTTHKRNTLGISGSGDQETVPLDPTGSPIHKDTLPSLGDVAALPNKHRRLPK